MKQPEIRFNGFSDEWVEKNILEMNISIKTGKLNANAAVEDGPYPFFTTAAEPLRIDKYAFDDDAILVAGNGNLGMIKEYTGKFNAYQREYVLTGFENYYKPYLGAYFRHLFKGHIVASMKGSAMPYITRDVIESFKIQLPTLPEQQKIGALFSKYDAIIALYEQKLEELNALKKGLLQQMFDDGVATSHKPQATSHKPQVRFSGFNDEWVERKLGEIAEITGGRTPSTSDAKYWDGGKDWYTPSDLTIVRRRTRGSARTISQFASLRIWPQNTLLLSTRAGIGKMTILTKEASINQGLKAICLNENFDPDFMYTYQPSISKQANRLASGSTFTEISTHDVNKIKLNFPSHPEQQKIGSFFEKLDAEIAAEQTKIDLLKEQKKGLLERVL